LAQEEKNTEHSKEIYSVASFGVASKVLSTGKVPLFAITTSWIGRSMELVEDASITRTTCIPSRTLPNTVWRPSNQAVLAHVIKNWEPLVSGPSKKKKKSHHDVKHMIPSLK
jgi:hypothetical protein